MTGEAARVLLFKRALIHHGDRSSSRERERDAGGFREIASPGKGWSAYYVYPFSPMVEEQHNRAAGDFHILFVDRGLFELLTGNEVRISNMRSEVIYGMQQEGSFRLPMAPDSVQISCRVSNSV